MTHDSRNTDELLSALGVPGCPPLESYVDRLVDYVQERVRQRRATRDAALEIDDPLVPHPGRLSNREP